MSGNWVIAALAAAFVCFTASIGLAIEGKAVVLQGLDKVTARVSSFETPIGKCAIRHAPRSFRSLRPDSA